MKYIVVVLIALVFLIGSTNVRDLYLETYQTNAEQLAVRLKMFAVSMRDTGNMFTYRLNSDLLVDGEVNAFFTDYQMKAFSLHLISIEIEEFVTNSRNTLR